MTLKDITELNQDDLYDLRVHNYIKIKLYDYKKVELIKEEAKNKNIELYIRYWEKVKNINKDFIMYKCFDRFEQTYIFNINKNIGGGYYIIYDYNTAIDIIKLNIKNQVKRKRLNKVNKFKSLKSKRTEIKKNQFIKTFLRLG